LSICFTLTLIDKMLYFLPRSLLGVLAYLGADFHFQNIAKGIIDTRDILYFLSVCFVGLYGAYLALQHKH
jgi:ABC-2 type transport system permease protein